MGVVGNTGLIFTMSNAGLAIGALFWGLLADVIGESCMVPVGPN
jgi:MFS family permease